MCAYFRVEFGQKLKQTFLNIGHTKQQSILLQCLLGNSVIFRTSKPAQYVFIYTHMCSPHRSTMSQLYLFGERMKLPAPKAHALAYWKNHYNF